MTYQELSCSNCPFDIEQPNGKPFCIQDATCEISVNWLNEHEQKIYNQALEDFENRYREWLKSEYGKIVANDALPMRVIRSLRK